MDKLIASFALFAILCVAPRPWPRLMIVRPRRRGVASGSRDS
jgi:hypothetical protein